LCCQPVSVFSVEVVGPSTSPPLEVGGFSGEEDFASKNVNFHGKNSALDAH
jgi:hypothetical protein